MQVPATVDGDDTAHLHLTMELTGQQSKADYQDVTVTEQVPEFYRV